MFCIGNNKLSSCLQRITFDRSKSGLSFKHTVSILPTVKYNFSSKYNTWFTAYIRYIYFYIVGWPLKIFTNLKKENDKLCAIKLIQNVVGLDSVNLLKFVKTFYFLLYILLLKFVYMLGKRNFRFITDTYFDISSQWVKDIRVIVWWNAKNLK